MTYRVSTYGMSGYGLNSFEAVEACYNNTKPIISRNHTLSEDIRPIGDRGRKHERVVKFSDTCYMLCSGEQGDNATWYYKYHEDGCNVYPSSDPHDSYYKRMSTLQDVSETLTFAPVVWTRHDGFDTIRIRNGSGFYAHNSRYSFIDRCLPNGLEATIGDGKQYIVNKGVRYLLPKSLWFASSENAWGGSSRNDGMTEDDKHYLVFRQDHGSTEFKLIGNMFKWHADRYGVDKDAKAKYKKQMDAMWFYVCTIAPMFNNIFGGRDRSGSNYYYADQSGRYQQRRASMEDSHGEVKEYVETHYEPRFTSEEFTNRYHYSRGTKEYEASLWKHAHFPVPLIADILNDNDHPLRLHLAKEIMSDMEDIVDCQSKEEASKIRSKYNQWFNRHMGFSKLVEQEHITKEKV